MAKHQLSWVSSNYPAGYTLSTESLEEAEREALAMSAHHNGADVHLFRIVANGRYYALHNPSGWAIRNRLEENFPDSELVRVVRSGE